jgi:hypothetical protein
MASSIPSPEEALAGMAKVGAPRTPMGLLGVQFSAPSAAPESGNKVPKNSGKGVDPAIQGKGTRNAVMGEQKGGAYSIGDSYMKQTEPAAGATMQHARLFKSVIQRSKPNFQSGIDSTY